MTLIVTTLASSQKAATVALYTAAIPCNASHTCISPILTATSVYGRGLHDVGVFDVCLQGLLQSGSQAEIVAELLKLICKAFWSATYMGIPDMLLHPDQFVGWMTCIHTLMDMPVPKARPFACDMFAC